MEGRSPARAKPFPASRLIFGVVAIVVLSALVVRAVPRRSDPGSLVYHTYGTVLVRALETGAERFVATGPGSDVALDPSGTKIAYTSEPNVHVIEIATRAIRVVAEGSFVGWAPEGRVVVRPLGSATLASVGTDGRPIDVYRGETDAASLETLWISGRMLVVSTFVPNANPQRFMETVRLRADGPHVVHRLKRARALAASPDGSELLYVQDAKIKVLRISDFTSRTVAPVRSVAAAAPGPRGVALVATDDEGRSGVLVLDPSLRSSRMLEVRGRITGGVVWTRDGSGVAYSDGGAIRVLPVRGGAARMVTRANEALLLGLAGR